MANGKIGSGDKRRDVVEHRREALIISLCPSNQWAMGKYVANKSHGDESIFGDSGARLYDRVRTACGCNQ
jgi:hypothetical protein